MTDLEMNNVLTIARGMEQITPPIESVVAELAGIAPARLEATLVRGIALAESDNTVTDPTARFALEFRQIQATWKTFALKYLVENSKMSDKAVAMRELRWILACMDRATFDLAKPAKGAARNYAGKPDHKKKDVAKATKLLAS